MFQTAEIWVALCAALTVLCAALGFAVHHFAQLARRGDKWRERASEAVASARALTVQMERERRSASEKIALLSDARREMTSEFRALAGQVMREHGEDFKKSAHDQIAGIVGPLKENIGRFEGEMRSARENAVREQTALKQQLGFLSEQSAAVSREAETLAKALRGDNRAQGAWGEAILTRLLEMSGLEEGREYSAQQSFTGADGRRQRPDVIVTLPGDKQLVIDSKVSLTAYDRAVNAEDDALRAAATKEHVASLFTHVKELAAKGYAGLARGSADYVIMFVPIEGALSEALRARGDLTEFALERQVMIATPTTLMMALRTIRNVWDVEKRSENAEAIAERAGKLFDKVHGFATDMERVGKHLDDARLVHEQAVTKLSTGPGNILRQVEMLKTLGAKTNKSLPLLDDKQSRARPPAPATPQAG